MRGRMSDAPSYAALVEIGEVMVGGTVSQVVASKNPKFKEGEWVLSGNGCRATQFLMGLPVKA